MMLPVLSSLYSGGWAGLHCKAVVKTGVHHRTSEYWSSPTSCSAVQEHHTVIAWHRLQSNPIVWHLQSSHQRAAVREQQLPMMSDDTTP